MPVAEMRVAEIDTNKVQFLPKEAWTVYEVQNDKHGGLLAKVFITAEYAARIEATGLPVNLAVISLWSETL